jgi:hypothetical protein
MIKVKILKESYIPIKKPADPDEDMLWYLADQLWNMIPQSAKTWDRVYDSDAKNTLVSQIRRGIETMQETGDSRKRLKDIQGTLFITLTRVDPNIHNRGDYRYSSEKLVDVLNSGKDLAPVAVGSIDGKTLHILDGHHRMRAYQEVGKKMLAFVVSIEHDNQPPRIKFSVK